MIKIENERVRVFQLTNNGTAALLIDIIYNHEKQHGITDYQFSTKRTKRKVAGISW